MRPNLALNALWVWSFFLLSGCDSRTVITTKTPQDELNDLDLPKVEVVDRANLENHIAAQKGKVVLIDYWATWCEPCVKQFPRTVAFSQKYKDRGLSVFSLSFDSPDAPTGAQEFLKESNADFPHFISKFGSSVDSFEDFEIDSVPHFRIYGRDGSLLHKWDGELEEEEIKQRIEEALSAETSP